MRRVCKVLKALFLKETKPSPQVLRAMEAKAEFYRVLASMDKTFEDMNQKIRSM